MDSQKPQSRAGFKRSLLTALMAGAGSLVLASAVMAAPAADTPRAASTAQVLKRAEEVRAQLTREVRTSEKGQAPLPQLAWWGNWRNGGWHPYWHNWPNWHNWHNWPNWSNYYPAPPPPSQDIGGPDPAVPPPPPTTTTVPPAKGSSGY